jgi:drug/metabolite transporter (DMT)-like permease
MVDTNSKWLSLLLAILGTVVYHLMQKSTPRAINPFFSLSLTYSCALLLCVVSAFLSPSPVRVVFSWSQTNWASIACGACVFGAELGYLLAYRAAWDLKRLALISNVMVAIALVPLGVLLFRERLSPRILVGFVLCTAGLMAMLD